MDTNEWLRGPPAYGTHLPGAGLTLSITPMRYAITLAHTRELHGLITHALDVGHLAHEPTFALLPWPTGCGWAVYVANDAHVQRLQGRAFTGRLFEREVTATFGHPVRIKTPTVERRGHRRVVIDTVTPVVIRSMGTTVARVRPTEQNLVSTLTATLASRLGLAHTRDGVRHAGLDRAAVPLEVVRDETFYEPQRYSKLGPVTGWEGRVVVDTNATGEWLLRCAAAGLGLGGRTAFGFGRVRVSTAVDEQPAPIAGPWFITPHALERYVAIVGSTGSRESDLARLGHECGRAHHVKATRDDCHLWRGPKPRRLRFIVGPGEGEKLALVTVLPACDAAKEGGS